MKNNWLNEQHILINNKELLPVYEITVGFYTLLIYITDYLAELNEWGPIFTLWSNSEDKLSQALGAVAKSVEKNFLSMQELVSSCPHLFLHSSVY